MPKLQVLLPDGVATSYDLTDEQLTIGRGSNNTIKIDDVKASRNHCTISKESDGGFTVKDLDSRNGTKLNGVKIAAKTKLKVGDVIRIGQTKFAFEKFPDGYNDDDDDEKTVATSGDTIVEGPKYVLEVVEGKSTGGIIELKDGVTTFGRKSSNDVTIDDDKASGNHCEVRKEAMGYILVDLESTNGTRFRAAGRTEYEKVTKVPLSVGSEIRIGATVYRYKNVGAPNPDDEVLAEIAGGKGAEGAKPAAATAAAAGGGGSADSTAQPHTGKTVHAARPVASPMAMAGLGVVVAVALLAVVAYFIMHRGSGGGGGGGGAVIQPPGQLPPKVVDIKDGDFQLPVNADGTPVDWAVLKSDKQKVSAVSDPKGGADSKNMVAAVDKTGSSDPSALFELASDHFEVSPGSAYVVSARLRNSLDSDGLFGVKLQFYSVKHELVAEYPFLLTGQHDAWFVLGGKDFLARSPERPTYGQLVLVSVGNKGTVYFDDVKVTEMPSADPARVPKSVSAAGVRFQPRDFTGAFDVDVANHPALTGAHLAIITKKGEVAAGPDCISLQDMTSKQPQSSIFNPKLNESIAYTVSAETAGNGIAVTVNPKTAPSDPGYHLALILDLGPGYESSRVDAIGANGSIRPLAGADEGCGPGIDPAPQEVLFTKDSLTLSISTERSGNFNMAVSHLANGRRQVTFVCDQGIQLFISPESQTLQRASSDLLTKIDQAIAAKHWGEALKAIDDFKSHFADHFPGMVQKVTADDAQIDQAFNSDLDTATRAIPPGDGPIPQDVANAVLPVLERLRDAWQGTSHETAFAALIAQVNKRIESATTVATNQADKALDAQDKKIQATLAKSKTDDVRNELTGELVDYTAMIQKAGKDTPAGKAALQKLTDYTNKDLQRLTDEADLLDSVSQYVTAGNYSQARDFILNHPTYQKYTHPGSMPRLEAALDRWAKGQK
ncbi:MAG: FHA domain-containing protein [Planctomycetota bacterium]